MKLIRKLWHLFCRTPAVRLRRTDPSGFLAASWLRMVNQRAYGLEEDEPIVRVRYFYQPGATKEV